MLAWNGLKWPRSAEKAAYQPEFGHFSPSGNICSQHLPGFLKRWLLKICPFSPERHRNWVFWTAMSLETTRERKEKGGERGEKKKGLLALIIFILPTLEIVSERQKSARDTPLGHLNRAVPFSKIQVYVGMKWAKMAKKCWKGRSSARIRSFFTIWQHLLATSTWIFEKVAPEDLPIFTGTTPKLGFLDCHEPRNHTGEKREGRGERGEEKRTAGTHNFYIAYFGDSFWTTKKCSRHTARTPQPSGTVFKNPGIYIYIYIYTAISIKVVGSFQAYKTRPKGSVGSCKSVLVLRLSAVGQEL